MGRHINKEPIEAKYNKPIGQVLADLYNKGGYALICKELGISRSTANYWMLRFGVKRKAVTSG